MQLILRLTVYLILNLLMKKGLYFYSIYMIWLNFLVSIQIKFEKKKSNCILKIYYFVVVIILIPEGGLGQ
jgi:hypothetical protein